MPGTPSVPVSGPGRGPVSGVLGIGFHGNHTHDEPGGHWKRRTVIDPDFSSPDFVGFRASTDFGHYGICVSLERRASSNSCRPTVSADSSFSQDASSDRTSQWWVTR